MLRIQHFNLARLQPVAGQQVQVRGRAHAAVHVAAPADLDRPVIAAVLVIASVPIFVLVMTVAIYSVIRNQFGSAKVSDVEFVA